MPIDLVTPNRNYPLPEGANDLSHDVLRLIAALQAIDIDVAAILTAIVQKAPLLNAPLSGAPTAPTPSVGDNSTRIATTAWARLYFADFVGAAPGALDTIAELAAALQNNPDIINQLIASIAAKAPLTSPAFTGAPTAPTQPAGDASTKIASTQFVDTSFAKKASPVFSGTPTGPTAAPGTNTTQLATTAYVKAGLDLKLDARLNLGVVAQTITDWNTALDNGWYMGSAAANAPDGVNWFLGFVEAHGATGYRTQTVHDFVNDTTVADLKLWRRRQSGGVWNAWYKIQWSQAEQDARYVQLANSPFTRPAFESAQQAITAGGALTLAHGLSVKPKLYFAVLQCVTAAGGYSIGDEVLPNQSSNEAGSNVGLSVVPDATNINIRYGSGAAVFQITRKDTGAFLNITPANWKLVARAWA